MSSYAQQVERVRPLQNKKHPSGVYEALQQEVLCCFGLLALVSQEV